MANRSLLKNITTNTNQFVDLNCKRFKSIKITNIDTEEISINLAIAKDDKVGSTSFANTEGGYILKGTSIPTGVTIHIDGFDFTNLIGADAVEGGQKAVTGALKEDDYTLMISATDTNKLYSFFIEY
jgi:hypothetical protein